MEDREFKDLERRIRETRQLAEENHELLEKIYSSMVWNRVFRVIYWVVIIGIAIGVFYFLEPYLQNVLDVYSGLEGLDGFSSFGE